MDFTKILKERREHLSPSSIRTYNSILRGIYKNCFDDKEGDVSKFNDDEKVLKYLDTKTFNVRKTLLSALVCVCPNNEAYKKLMLNDIKTYNQDVEKMEESEKQKENSVTNDDIQSVLDRLRAEANVIFKKSHITVVDLQKVQDYIIVCLLGGQYIVPRRALDYTEMKIRNVTDENNENYIKNGKLVFSKYKTSRFYGKQELEMPKPLKLILSKWVKIIPESIDYLLFNTSGDKLTAITLNQRLNKIFNGKISVNALRHSYLTHKYADVMKKEEEMDNEMTDMGSSGKQAKVYVKIH